MYPVSDGFKKYIYDSSRELLAKVEIDLKNGTHLTLNNRDILEGGFEIEDAVSNASKFQVGAVIINQFILTLNNFENKFSGYDFTGAVIKPYVGLIVKKDWHGDTVEWVPKGVFTAEKPTAIGSRITVTALDNMANLDAVYSKSSLTYPATLAQIAADACSVCGVALGTKAFPNSNYSVSSRPSGNSVTCREILSYVAQLAGCFARCNTDGKMEIRWYEEGDALYDVGAGASSSSMADSDTVVTGVQIQGNDSNKTVYTSGASGFMVRIKNNLLAQDGLQTIADALGAKFNGYVFRAYTVTSVSNPAIEAGDIVNMTDKKGIVHKTIVSRLTYEIDQNEEYNAEAETISENQSERFTAAQKAQESADEAKNGVAKAELKIGDLEITIKGKVSFSDLSGSGKTEINGDNIVTGKIQSEDGSWWLDLKNGKFYLSDGVYAGEIVWRDDNGNTIGSIRPAGQAGFELSGTKISIESPDLSLNAQESSPAYAKNFEVGNDLKVIDGDIRVNGEKGISKDIPVRNYDNSGTRYLEFRDGICIGVHD